MFSMLIQAQNSILRWYEEVITGNIFNGLIIDKNNYSIDQRVRVKGRPNTEERKY